MTKILVIEDEISLRENTVELLELAGFEVVEAEDGQLGVQLAQEILPDLILCDVMMPELDGYGVLSCVRSNPTTSLIPFIFLTAKGTTYDFRQGMNLGADDYLTKPFKQQDLLDAIASRLNKQMSVGRLQQAIESLEQSNLLKDEFLSTASHELRSPLANIVMAVRMLQTVPKQEQQQRYLDLLQAECSREIELLNDLLDLQRLSTQTHVLQLEVLDLHDWLQEVVEVIGGRTWERQQTVQVNCAVTLPRLWLDSMVLRRILTELLSNACKYTAPGGKITLDVDYSCQQPTGDAASVAIASFVVSNEAEIPADQVPKLFDQFYRVPGGDRWQQGGSGLGLTLVKKLVECLNGTIQVASQAGWTRFTVVLPVQVAEN